MSAYIELSAARAHQIGTDYFREREARALPAEQPTVVLVGGQPGAGKSAAAAQVRKDLKSSNGYVHVDADRMRERLPLPRGSHPTSEETQNDARRLVQILRTHAIDQRLNIIEEGTYRDANAVQKFVSDRNADGYKVEMMAVATPREESLLGVYQRYETQHLLDAPNPRFVPEKYHDEAYAGFEDTIAKVQFDRVRVTNRAGDVLFDSRNNQGSALEALAEGRKLTDAKLASIGRAWLSVDELAKARNAPAAYLESVSRHSTRIQDMQSERIHSHAMKTLSANGQVLRGDPRYQQHTNQELVKAAYFRGFHEKACEFKRSQPDFVKYDTTVASRSALAQLPDVKDLAGKTIERTRTKDNDGLSL